ncbi:MAG: hypothetical protein CVT98_09180 [Bacteroidetes bacterium HGW-Bacteroidetes-15]|nr:MAG: hypothetical protein CVT98_09180 [Bacteroidetes bacterium HGW-Bacteroidetes-15]
MLKQLFSFISIFLFATIVNAQLLDSLSLEEKYEYTSLEEALKNPKDVYKLNLKRKKIIDLPKEIYQLSNLQILILRNNKITDIPISINKLVNLQYLDLSRNKIKEVPAEMFDLINLKSLSLSQNEIEFLPKEISKLENLEYLDLWGNQICEFPEIISVLSGTLKVLDMRVILMNQEKQNNITDLLPYTKIFFSSSCNCQ